MWKEFGLHFLDGDSLSMRADIKSGHYFAAGILNRNRHGAQSVLEFLINDRVAIAPNLPQGLRQFRGICDCAFGVAFEFDTSKDGFEFLWREVGQNRASHRGAKCRQPAAHTEVDRHNARHVGARDVDDIDAV